MISLLLLLLAQSPQAGVPSRGAGTATSSLSRYGADFGLNWRCSLAQPGIGTVLDLGLGAGVATAVTPTASATGQFPRNSRVTGAAANNIVTWSAGGVLPMWRGNSTNLGGFVAVLRWGVDTNTATTTSFAGWFERTLAFTCVALPASVANSLYMSCAAGETNYSVCSNDATGTATCTTLGAAFPCAQVPNVYDLVFTAEPNGATASYWVLNQLTQATAEGTLMTNLPTNTAFLSWQLGICNGAGGAVATATFSMACLTTK